MDLASAGKADGSPLFRALLDEGVFLPISIDEAGELNRDGLRATLRKAVDDYLNRAKVPATRHLHCSLGEIHDAGLSPALAAARAGELEGLGAQVILPEQHIKVPGQG